ncbi:phenylpyruvate tautomerase [Aureococcus anophagefferens]|nr:phenylpyruvate tautomerase [Aureococcus anophagefferens]
MPSVVVQAAVAPKSGAAGFCKLLSSTVAGTLGKPESYVLTTFTKAELGVPKGRYYINFFDSERSNMGYNGGTF